MMGQQNSGTPLLRRLRHSRKLSITGVVATWLLLVGCQQEEAAKPAANQASNNNADLFAEPAAKPKSNAQPPVAAAPPPANTGASGGSSLSLIPALDPETAKECQKLKEDEARLRKQAETLRVKNVAPASEAAEKAMDAFIECQEDFNCSSNEATYRRYAVNVKKTEEEMDKQEGQLMVIEGELHGISQKISIKCGEF